MPMAFIPVVLAIRSLQSTLRTKLMAYFFVTLVITANITIMIRHANHSEKVLNRFLPLQKLSSFDQDRRIRSIIVDLKNHVQSTMIALQFVNKKQLFLWSASYFNNNKQEHFSDVPHDGLLITEGCSIFDHKNMISLGKFYCAFLGPPKVANDYSIRFNRPLPPSLKTEGLGGREERGRWNNGDKTTLLIPIINQWQGATLILKGDPFLAKDLTKQRVIFSARGVPLKDFSVSREAKMTLHIDRSLFDNGYIPLTVDLPDSSSPSRYGSTDRRVLGFYFLSLHVRADNAVASLK